MQQDLADILVVSIEQAVAAPYASSKLADAGARVIKVERPEGDFARDYDTMVKGQSAYFVWLNRGKESLCLDLRKPDDLDLLSRVIVEADIVIENLKPGTLSKFGFDLDQLCAERQGLIACSISGFGQDGPYSHLKAYDLIVQAEVGLCSITGTPDGPARVGVSVCDIAAGMTAHAAILQALFGREKTGRGRRIQVSMFDALADWMNVPYLQFAYGGKEPLRSGVSHPTIAPYGAFKTNDGAGVILAVQNQREWEVFCEKVMGNAALAKVPKFATNMDRLTNRIALETLINERVRSLETDAITKLLEANGIAFGRLNGIHDLMEHPHLRRISVSTEAGEVHVIAPAPFGAFPNESAKLIVPPLGFHSAQIRHEFTRLVPS
jgi:crotonobetainyl-CoA:carnitine CoA-transferase CaiB-like acyl-CoA transferase